MFDLTGKKALVTGSTQGIGRAVAECFVRRGAEVTVHCAADSVKAEKVAHEIGAAGFAVYDLAEDSPLDLYNATGDTDILVLNASVQFRTKWRDIPDSELSEQLAVNFKSTLRLMQLYSPYMQKNGWGRILTIGSVQQYRPHPDMAVYAASKAAVFNLVQNTAKQLAGSGVTVNNLSPGVIDTPRNRAALSDPEYAARVLSGIPAGRTGTAEDCAGAALLLCSEAGGYITGIDLIVDGGMRL